LPKYDNAEPKLLTRLSDCHLIEMHYYYYYVYLLT